MALKRLPEGRGSNRHLTGSVRWVTYDFACSSTQPSAVEGSDRGKYATDNIGGLPNYTCQLIYITGRSAPKPDTDTKTEDTVNHRAIENIQYPLKKKHSATRQQLPCKEQNPCVVCVACVAISPIQCSFAISLRVSITRRCNYILHKSYSTNTFTYTECEVYFKMLNI